ncbi:MAG: hypothetical protein JWP02_267 [Acidimicrobiales bacterium]|nr:hypothetical protein [Acidimicrobiales bacterium]
MVVGSLAGVAVLYELVLLAHRKELATQLHSPGNVWVGAACLLIVGWAMAMAAPRVARWFGMFVAAGGFAAGAVAGYGQTEVAYALPLLGFGLVGAVIVVASYLNEQQVHRHGAA